MARKSLKELEDDEIANLPAVEDDSTPIEEAPEEEPDTEGPNPDVSDFGDQGLLSQNEYQKLIHAADTYGRSPSAVEPSVQTEASLPLKKNFKDAFVPDADEESSAPLKDTEKEAEKADIVGETEAEKKPVSRDISENADEIMSGLPSEEMPSPVQVPSQLSKFQDYMKQYSQLRDQQRKSDLVAGLATAGGQIGQAMAGKYSGHFVPDESGIKVLQAQANRPIQQFEQGLAIEKAGQGINATRAAQDPTSPQSRMVRQYINQKFGSIDPVTGKQTGLHLDDDVSAADAQMFLKAIGRPGTEKATNVPLVNQKTGEKVTGIWHPIQQMFTTLDGHPLGPDYIRDYRAQSFLEPKTGERLGFSGGTGKTTGALTGPGVSTPIVPAPGEDVTSEKPIQINKSFLNNKQTEQVDHYRKQFIKEVQDDRNSLNANDRVIKVLEAGQELGDLPREIQDQLNRAFGQKGHISDAQLGGLLGKPDWRNRVENAVSLGMNGKLTPENRKFLLDVARLIKSQNQQYIDNKSQYYTQNLYGDLQTAPNLQKYKFGPDSVKNLLGVESASHPEGTASNPNEIKRKTADGRIAIYDQNKKFLRYQDQAPQQEMQQQETPEPNEESDEDQEEQ